MTREELIEACSLERVAVFLEPADIFDKGIIGVSSDCFHVIYDYEKLIDAYIEEEKCPEEEAIEWIDYNTLGSLPIPGEGSPIVMFPVISE